MPEENNQEEPESKTLYSKVVHKTLRNGAISQSHTVEVKKFGEATFMQITQDKMPFGSQPAKRTWITMDPKNEELKSAVAEGFKVGQKA